MHYVDYWNKSILWCTVKKTSNFENLFSLKKNISNDLERSWSAIGWGFIYFWKTKVSRERMVATYFPHRITIEQEDNISVTPAFSETKLTVHSQVTSLEF